MPKLWLHQKPNRKYQNSSNQFTDGGFYIMKWINRVEIVLLFVIVSALYYLYIPLPLKRNIQITSSNPHSVIKQLKKDGYPVGIVDTFILEFFGDIKPGRVYLGRHNNNRLEILKIVASKRGRYKKITLIPGETTVIFLKELSQKMNLDEEKLHKYFNYLCRYQEASILADSYNIPVNYDEKNIIRLLCRNSENVYKSLSYKYYGEYNPKEWKKILIIASIIQKEAANTQEMPKISSVIRNRLKKRMRLQMDGSLNYGKYSHIKVTPQRIKSDKSTYNTYKHAGLPNEPVCNVSLYAIKAAVNPSKTDYLYFMKNDSNHHDFASTYAQHLKNVQKKRKELKQQNKYK